MIIYMLNIKNEDLTNYIFSLQKQFSSSFNLQLFFKEKPVLRSNSGPDRRCVSIEDEVEDQRILMKVRKKLLGALSIVLIILEAKERH